MTAAMKTEISQSMTTPIHQTSISLIGEYKYVQSEQRGNDPCLLSWAGSPTTLLTDWYAQTRPTAVGWQLGLGCDF